MSTISTGARIGVPPIPEPLPMLHNLQAMARYNAEPAPPPHAITQPSLMAFVLPSPIL